MVLVRAEWCVGYAVVGFTFAEIHTLYFFFSSRRRHTRSLHDWSSDVCSSDLRESSLNLSHLDHLGEDVVRDGITYRLIHVYADRKSVV